MPQTPVLVDTWAVAALANTRDAGHNRAVEISRQLAVDGRPLVTTDWILSEFLSFAARPPHREAAVRMVQSLRAAATVEIVPATRDQWWPSRLFVQNRIQRSGCWGTTDRATGECHLAV